jgi:hypothetical protein
VKFLFLRILYFFKWLLIFQLVIQLNDLIFNNKTAISEEKLLSLLNSCLNNVKSKNSFQLIVNSIIKSNLKNNNLALKVFLNLINSNHEKFVVISELFFGLKLTIFLFLVKQYV